MRPSPRTPAPISRWVFWCVTGILSVLVATLSLSLLNAHRTPLAVNPFPFIDISRSFIPQSNFIVNLDPLRNQLQGLVDEYGSTDVSLYVEFLNTGANISVNPNLYVWPASLAKLPLAMAVMKKVEADTWELDNELVMMPGDRDNRSGSVTHSLADDPTGTRYSITRLLQELLTNSDNTAYNIFKRNMGDAELQSIVDELGLEELFSVDGRISAKEYSRIFRALYISSFLTREHSQQILQWLNSSPFDAFLSHDLAGHVPFPHKYGENVDLSVYADAGIIYIPNRPILITVMVKGNTNLALIEDRNKVASLMRAIASDIYTFFSSPSAP